MMGTRGQLLKPDVCIACAMLGWLLAVVVAVMLVGMGMGLKTGQPHAWRSGIVLLQFLPAVLVVMLPVLLVRAALSHALGPAIFALVGMAVAVPAFGLFHELFLPLASERTKVDWPGLVVFLVAGAMAGAIAWTVERALRPRRDGTE